MFKIRNDLYKLPLIKWTIKNYREDVITNEQIKKRLKEKFEMRKNKTATAYSRFNPMGAVKFQ